MKTNESNIFRKLIGDKKFYRMVLRIALPMIIQGGITNFVSLLDNIMVGRVGSEQMSGVSIANQLIFVYNLIIFGANSGAGIFSSQFYGQRDHDGIRHIFRFKMISTLLLTLIASAALYFFKEPLIKQFLHDGSITGDLDAALGFGIAYLLIMLIGLIPFCIKEVYASTLKETGQTLLPMLAGVIAVGTNLFLNYVLIFGNFGAPKLGVAGAAIATVVSRFVECAIVVLWTHLKSEKNIFIVSVYRRLYIPGQLVKKVILRGTPLLINESMWAMGMTMINQSYSTRGLDVVAGLSISSTVSNLFNVVFFSLGSSVAIIVGQLLGADKLKEAKESSTRLIAFSVASCVLVGAVMASISGVFPQIYNTTEEAKHYANQFILVAAAMMPFSAFTHAAYFTLRSGGKTLITFLFDSVYVWLVSVPLVFCLSRFTSLPILSMFLILQLPEFVKCAIGFVLVKKGVWINNVIKNESMQKA